MAESAVQLEVIVNVRSMDFLVDSNVVSRHRLRAQDAKTAGFVDDIWMG